MVFLPFDIVGGTAREYFSELSAELAPQDMIYDHYLTTQIMMGREVVRLCRGPEVSCLVHEFKEGKCTPNQFCFPGCPGFHIRVNPLIGGQGSQHCDCAA